MDERCFYGYKHWTLENVSRCFYVGKGLRGRPNYGKPQPEEVRRKNSEANRKRALERARRKK